MTRTEDDEDRALDSPEARFGERFRSSVSAEMLQAKVIETETRSLARTFEELSRTGAVSRAATLILGARRRYIAGRGKAVAYADLLAADLSATLSNVFLVEDRALSPLTVLTDVRATDVLVLFTMRRYREESIRFGERFRATGGELIIVTDSDDAPLTDVASAVIRVHTHSASYADSPTSVAAVCHLLSTITTASAKGARRRLAARDEIAVELGLHHPDAADGSRR